MRRAWGCLGILLILMGAAGSAWAQATPARRSVEAGDDMVQLDFNDVELSVVIDTIARLTSKNFIYDDRVRGRVTIVSPTKITVDQAYAVFESVLQVKGFTTVQGPGGAIKVIPIRDAKESNIETLRGRRRPPNSDRYITRLIPLRYIDAEAITNTLKPLVSKDASMVAYAPTNTVILTDAATNIRRLLTILESIDVETYKEELAVIKILHADANSMTQQLSEIFGAQTSAAPTPATRRARARSAAQATTSTAASPGSGQVRILTDERTNSLIVLASRPRLQEIRDVVAKLDVPVTGGGRIHVYYLKHADAEELANTLSGLLGGGGGAPATGGRGAQATPQALRAAITELSDGITVTADPPTNALVIQGSQEGYSTLKQVIEQLDIERPQVLVEALIMEVDVTNGEQLGFNAIVRLVNDNTQSGAAIIPTSTDSASGLLDGELTDFTSTLIQGVEATSFLGAFRWAGRDTAISGIMRAAASDNRVNIVSAPHILTSDNEEAEIRIGDNIPIITSRVQSASGVVDSDNLATSVNVEREDIGVTLRVTPQISEGDTVRLQIFQEITNLNDAIQGDVGNVEQVGPALSNRKIENTVVANDGETVVIGGLIDDNYSDTESKVPFLGDIPILGWLFKSTSRTLTKKNLLVFLTPNIVRSAEDLEEDTIRKREEFWERSGDSLQLSERERKDADERRAAAEAAGLTPSNYTGRNPVRGRLLGHSRRYPVERMLEIERLEKERTERRRDHQQGGGDDPSYGVLAAVFRDETAAAELLTQLVDAGYEGTLVSGANNGTLLLELRLGPYPDLATAEEVAATVRRAYSLSPTVVVERSEP